MKLTITKNHFSDLLKAVSPAVSARSTLPVLADIRLLVAEDTPDTLSGAATNLQYGILKFADCQSSEPGGICVPARLITDIVATMSGEDITLETTRGEALVITGGGSRTEIKGLPADEFPPMPPYKLEGAVIPQKALERLIKQTAFAASTDDARPVLQGIIVRAEKGCLSLAATDGFRISVAREPGEFTIEPSIVPADTLRCLSKLISGDAHVRRPAGTGQIVFTGDTWQLVSQIIDGNFPDYNVLLPRAFRTRVLLSPGPLRLAVQRAKFLDGARPVTLEVKADDAGATLTVRASSEETGETSAQIPAEASGPAQMIAFNSKFLSEALEVLGGQLIVIEMNDGKSPARLTVPGGESEFLHVIMPLHVG